MKFDEDFEVAVMTEDWIVQTAIEIKAMTGRIPPIYEITGDGYPSAYLEDIKMAERSVHFQISHLLGELDE